MLWTSNTQDNCINKTVELDKFRPDRSICQVNNTKI